MAHYLDTSALVKLVAREAETAALRKWLAAEERDVVASDLVRTELMRAVRRRDKAAAQVARAVLDGLTLLPLSADVFDTAGLLDSVDLRSLDAIHLASARTLGDDLEGIVTYDDRLARAAADFGLPTISPALAAAGVASRVNT